MTTLLPATSTRALRTVVFSLGTNLGDRDNTLQGAVDLLSSSRLLHRVRVSAVYETDPVGGPEQPSYLNAVVVCESDAAPVELLGLAYQVEQAHGRTREERWGPRTLDVDLLAVGDLRSEDPTLTLPHPRAHERGFVLVPWAQVDPDAQIVGHGPVAVLVAALDAGSGAVRRVDLILVVGG